MHQCTTFPSNTYWVDAGLNKNNILVTLRKQGHADVALIIVINLLKEERASKQLLFPSVSGMFKATNLLKNLTCNKSHNGQKQNTNKNSAPITPQRTTKQKQMPKVTEKYCNFPTVCLKSTYTDTKKEKLYENLAFHMSSKHNTTIDRRQQNTRIEDGAETAWGKGRRGKNTQQPGMPNYYFTL